MEGRKGKWRKERWMEWKRKEERKDGSKQATKQ
jgi:hypothetical protein